MRILVTGAAGRLGGRLVDMLSTNHTVINVDVDTLDVTHWNAVHERLHDERPELVIHAAAWTDVDGCALNPQRAVLVNGLGPQNVAAAAHEIGAMIVYISSNEVFDGQTRRPYMEYDTPQPANPYGYSKLVGERAVAAVNPRHMIIRTSWLFAHGGKNFIHAIINAAREGKSLRVVTDEVANPTYNDDLARAIGQLIETQRPGTYHLVNEGACSRYDFARYVLDATNMAHLPITRITRHQYKRPSTPPLYSVLDNVAAAALGVRLRPWQAAVDAFLLREGLLSAP